MLYNRKSCALSVCLISFLAIVVFVSGCARTKLSPNISNYYLAHSVSWPLTSKISGQTYQIYVALPPDYGLSEKSYGVIYVVDANMQFATVVETARNLSSEGAIPDQIIVGIGYPIEPGWAALMPLRSSDLTPTRNPSWQDGINEHLEKRGEPLIKATGNADTFSRFIGEELIPEIASRYKVSDTERTFFGHSFGALFATYVLFHNPELFNKYLLASPSYWWDEEVSFTFEEAYSQRHKDLAATVFISAGELEQTEALAQWAAVDNIYKMERRINSRNYPGVKVKTHMFEGETHMSVVPAAISRGLRYLAQAADER